MADSTARIHIDDMVNGILWLLDNDLRGPFNMVSPYPVHTPMRWVMRSIDRRFSAFPQPLSAC